MVYLAVLEVSVSEVLVEDDKGMQSPIFCVGKTLLDTETRYHQLEK